MGDVTALGRYDSYILTQLVVLFGFFSLILISVYWLNEAVDLFDALITDGQSLMVFLEISLLTIPHLMLIVLPVAGFVATLYVFNRLIGDSEMVVLQTSGLSALRLLRPVFYFGLLLAIVISILAHVLSPAARTQSADRSQEIRADLTGKFLRAGEFFHPAPGLTVYVREITELGEFQDVFLHDQTDPTAEITYIAPRALLVPAETGPRLVMFDGMAQTLEVASQRLGIVRFADFNYDIGALIEEGGLRNLDIRELPTLTLLTADAATAQLLGLPLAQMRFIGHDRIGRALFVIFLPLLGASVLMLGNFSRFGVWPQIFFAVCLAIPLEAIWNASEAAALQNADLAYLAYARPLAAAMIAAAIAGLAMSGKFRKPQMDAAT